MTPLEDLPYVDLPESWLDEDHRRLQRMQSCFEQLADAKKQTGMGSKIRYSKQVALFHTLNLHDKFPIK